MSTNTKGSDPFSRSGENEKGSDPYLAAIGSAGWYVLKFRMSSIVVGAAAVLTLAAMPALAHAQAGCSALPPSTGTIVDVTPAQVASLQSILDAARSGDTVQLGDGVYSLPETLVVR